MATQPTNLVDSKTLDRIRREMEGDNSPQLPDVVQDAVDAASAVADPVREVFVGVPELKTFIVGYVFGAITVAATFLISRILN